VKVFCMRVCHPSLIGQPKLTGSDFSQCRLQGSQVQRTPTCTQPGQGDPEYEETDLKVRTVDVSLRYHYPDAGGWCRGTATKASQGHSLDPSLHMMVILQKKRFLPYACSQTVCNEYRLRCDSSPTLPTLGKPAMTLGAATGDRRSLNGRTIKLHPHLTTPHLKQADFVEPM
jgi:hypothetical protein